MWISNFLKLFNKTFITSSFWYKKEKPAQITDAGSYLNNSFLIFVEVVKVHICPFISYDEKAEKYSNTVI